MNRVASPRSRIWHSHRGRRSVRCPVSSRLFPWILIEATSFSWSKTSLTVVSSYSVYNFGYHEITNKYTSQWVGHAVFSRSNTFDLVAVDPLCAATAVWNSEAVTVAGLLTGVSSSLPTGLKGPNDVLVDGAGNLFVADSDNNRVAYWPFNATQGRVVMGTGAIGSWSNLFKYAAALVGKYNRWADPPSACSERFWDPSKNSLHCSL